VRHGSGDLASGRDDQTRQLYQALSTHGRLVKEDGGTRFMDSIILGTIYEEVCRFAVTPGLSIYAVH